MGRLALTTLSRWIAAFMLLLGGALVSASPVAAAEQIYCALPTGGDSLATLDAAELRQISCTANRVDLDAKRNALRLEVTPGETPRFVISRAAKFASIHVGVVTKDAVTWSHHDFETIEATFFDRQFAVPLPDYEGQAEAVIVEVDMATQATTFDHLHLTQALPGTSRADIAALLVIAAFVGMMLMPILFDLVFYRVLRETFILWHVALVASLAVQLVCSFGLYTAFFEVHLPMVRIVTIGSFNLMVIAGIMFSLRFIERDLLPARISKVVLWMTAVFTVLSLIHMAGIEALGRWPSTVYFASGGVLGIAFIALLTAAFRGGSRTVRFLIVGLSPLLLVAFTRVISFILPGIPVIDANELLLVATTIEVAATALGVANRFLALKLDRDRFHAEKDMLEGAAESDHLTGLYNRRAIDHRFEDLRKGGFHTFALIDLDRFKDINDRYGHQTGDAVLEASARAMKEADADDCVAMRLGGEEFVLLLRGERATERAEKVRQAIPRRIAGDVADLDRLVTASMGVLELPREAGDMMSFEEIYSRADTLLYEAKSAGRNRMFYEKLQIFRAPRRVQQETKKRARA